MTIKQLHEEILTFVKEQLACYKGYTKLIEDVNEKVRRGSMYPSEAKQRIEDYKNSVFEQTRAKQSHLDELIRSQKQKTLTELENTSPMMTADQSATLQFLSTVKPGTKDLISMLKAFQDNPLAFNRVLEIAQEKHVYLPKVLTKIEVATRLFDTYTYYLDSFSGSALRSSDQVNNIRIGMIYDGMEANINQYLSKLNDYDGYLESLVIEAFE